MATNPKDTTARKRIGKFARTLLAATCLTAAGGAAIAGNISYTEGTSPAPTDFPNTIGSPTLLTAASNPGTTNVSGGISGSDLADFFELTGLGSGTFTLSATTTGNYVSLSVFNSADTLLEGGGTNQTSGAGTFTGSLGPLGALAIPADGNLVIEIERYHEDTTGYTVTVNTAGSSVPEPTTVGLVGLGLAGALTLGRKRRKQ